VAADDAGVVLEAAGGRQELPFDGLGPGRIQVEFTRLAALSDTDLEDMLDPIDDDGDTDDADAADNAVTGEDEQEEDEE
jgi:ribosome maturation factor RimP